MNLSSSEIDAINYVLDLIELRKDAFEKFGPAPKVKPSKGDYSLYAHYTADTNEIFYVGICKGSRLSTRPAEKYGRSEFWNRIHKKHGSYHKIILTGFSKEFIISAEVWLIGIYGKRKDGGLLCNITDGGEGVIGATHSPESKRKMSVAKTGRTGDKCPNSIAVICEGVRYGSMAEAGRALGVCTQTILNRVRKENYKNYYVCK